MTVKAWMVLRRSPGGAALLFGAIASVMLAACGSAGPTPRPSASGTDEPVPPASTTPSLESGACPDGPLFSRAPVDLEDIASISPLGSLIPPGHTFPTPHLYLFVFDADDVSGMPATIYAPADLIVTNVVYKYQQRGEPLSDYTDFDMHFQVCEGVELYFIHVRSITHPEIVAAMQSGECAESSVEHDHSECHLRMSLPVAAGSVLGTTGDFEARIFGLDVGMRDYRLPEGRSAFANPDRWCTEGDPFIAEHCYAACFFDYMEQSSAGPYLDLVRRGSGEGAVQRREEPRCGTIYHDVVGTAQGYWFPSLERLPSEASSLFVGPNDFLPSYGSFSISEAVPGLRSFVYTFATESSGKVNLRFDAVGDEDVYCYERLYDSLESLLEQAPHNMEFVILLQLSEGGQRLTIEKQEARECGFGPWAFSDGSVVFYR